jgi:hypothetical protein
LTETEEVQPSTNGQTTDKKRTPKKRAPKKAVPKKAIPKKKASKPAKRAKKVQKRTVTTRYPGLREDIIKVFESHPQAEFRATDIQKRMPEVSSFSVSYHLAQLAKIRILHQKVSRGPYSFGSRQHRAGPSEEAPLAVNARRLPSDQATKLQRQRDSIVLRMLNAPELFTAIDVETVRQAFK